MNIDNKNVVNYKLQRTIDRQLVHTVYIKYPNIARYAQYSASSHGCPVELNMSENVTAERFVAGAIITDEPCTMAKTEETTDALRVLPTDTAWMDIHSMLLHVVQFVAFATLQCVV